MSIHTTNGSSKQKLLPTTAAVKADAAYSADGEAPGPTVNRQEMMI
jgi:hypothetical protein